MGIARTLGRGRRHRRLLGPDAPHEVVEDAGGDVLVERALLAVAPEVELERFEFDDRLARCVGDRHLCEVWLARHRTDARELRRLAAHLVVAPRMRVGDRDQLLGRARGHGGPRYLVPSYFFPSMRFIFVTLTGTAPWAGR